MSVCLRLKMWSRLDYSETDLGIADLTSMGKSVRGKRTAIVFKTCHKA